MKVVHNERVKLTATFLNGVAIALFALSGLTPVVQVLRDTAIPFGEWTRTLLVGTICVLASLALHFGARAILRALMD